MLFLDILLPCHLVYGIEVLLLIKQVFFLLEISFMFYLCLPHYASWMLMLHAKNGFAQASNGIECWPHSESRLGAWHYFSRLNIYSLYKLIKWVLFHFSHRHYLIGDKGWWYLLDTCYIHAILFIQLPILILVEHIREFRSCLEIAMMSYCFKASIRFSLSCCLYCSFLHIVH